MKKRKKGTTQIFWKYRQLSNDGVFKKKSFCSDSVCSWSSKLQLFFLPKTPHNEIWNHFPHNSIPKPTKYHFQQAKRSITRLGIIHTNPTRQKKVFHRALAISQCRKRWFTNSLGLESSLSSRPNKECYFQWNLILPNTPPREMSAIMGNKDIVVRFNIKLPSLERNITKFVFVTLSQSERVQQIGERDRAIHLSVVSRSEKANIPLMRFIRKLQMIYHKSILTTGQTEWKIFLEGLIPTHVMPESNSGAITDLKSSMTGKRPLTSDILPNF